MDSGPQDPSSGGHSKLNSKMSPTSTLRGLGLGETPLRRWEAVTEMGRSQALIRTIATPSQRQTIDRGMTDRQTWFRILHDTGTYTTQCRDVPGLLTHTQTQMQGVCAAMTD
jgi:hypothetical protein